MKQPSTPLIENFGVTSSDVNTIWNFAGPNPVMFLCAGAIAVVWIVTLSVSSAGRDNFIVSVVFVCLFAIFFAWLLSLMLDLVLDLCWPTYARLSHYRKALKQYRAELVEYEAWVRRQAIIFWKSLSGIAFERELGRLFQKADFKVYRTPRTADGGVDLILERSGRRTVVQCKARASKVGISTARELVASMIDFKAEAGIIAVTSGVTKPVLDYIAGKNIEIYDLGRIIELHRRLD